MAVIPSVILNWCYYCIPMTLLYLRRHRRRYNCKFISYTIIVKQKKWKLLINTKKSKIVVFRKGTRTCQEIMFYGEILIPVCSHIPYLGLVFSSNGSYYRTQSTLADQLHKILLRFKGITLSAALHPFDKLITPILCYGCEVWGFPGAGYWTCSFVFL